VLLFLFLFNLVGYYLVFIVVQQEIRQEKINQIKSGVPDNELTIFHFSGSEMKRVKWFEKGKEFLYNNELYDVVRMEMSGQETIIHCISDARETRLFANLDDQVRKEMNSGQTRQRAVELIKKVNFNYLLFDNKRESRIVQTVLTPVITVDLYKSVSLDQIIPPPKFI
jgi:hypothetical protein